MHYDEPVFRPPSEARSLILQATIGCSHNRCAFCGMYKQKRFHVREFSELRDDILEGSQRWPETRRVFLANGDALMLSTEELIRILDLLDASFPHLSRVGTYVNASNVQSKTDKELQALSAKKLTIGYLGLESGNDEVLAEMHKGATAEEMITAVQRGQENGIKMSVMVLLGLGGESKNPQHAADTAKALNRMHPRFLSFLSVMPAQGTRLSRKMKRDEFMELSPRETLEEMKEIIQVLELKNTIFRSNHASNYLALSGRFPRDKERLLSEIEACLSGQTMMREDWVRGL